MKGGDEPKNTRALLFEEGSSKLEGRRPFLEIFGNTQQEAWGENFYGVWKHGNHHFHELLSSLVFEFL